MSNSIHYEWLRDISYVPESEPSPYARERCLLDLYYPANRKGYSTLIWIHGGGLNSFSKEVPAELMDRGLAVVAINYRLYPRARCPEFIEDAASAVAWVFNNLGRFGGSPDNLFVSGHSAGCYLGDMLTLDKHWLARHGIDADRIAGNISLSAHKVTHFAIRAERGIPEHRVLVDELAPLYHIRAEAPPMLLVTGDRKLELLARYEENAYFTAMMKLAGHRDITLHEIKGYDHGGMTGPSFPLLLDFVERIRPSK